MVILFIAVVVGLWWHRHKLIKKYRDWRKGDDEKTTPVKRTRPTRPGKKGKEDSEQKKKEHPVTEKRKEHPVTEQSEQPNSEEFRIETDAGMMVMHLNPAACVLLGYDGDEEVVGRPCVSDVVAEEGREAMAEALETAINSSKHRTSSHSLYKATIGLDLPLLCKDGSVTPIVAEVTPKLDYAGETVGAVIKMASAAFGKRGHSVSPKDEAAVFVDTAIEAIVALNAGSGRSAMEAAVTAEEAALFLAAEEEVASPMSPLIGLFKQAAEEAALRKAAEEAATAKKAAEETATEKAAEDTAAAETEVAGILAALEEAAREDGAAKQEALAEEAEHLERLRESTAIMVAEEDAARLSALEDVAGRAAVDEAAAYLAALDAMLKQELKGMITEAGVSHKWDYNPLYSTATKDSKKEDKARIRRT